MPIRNKDHRRFLRALAGLPLFGATPVIATTYTWSGSGANNNWSNSVNWSGTIVPVSAATTDIIFAANAARTDPNQDLGDNFTVQSLTFNNAKKSSLAGGSIILDGAAIVQTINVGADVTISNNFNLAANTTYSGSGSTSFLGIIAGAGGLTKNGGGLLFLRGVNTFTGPTTINAGQILIGNSASLANSTVDINVNNGLISSFALGSASLGNLAGIGNWDLNGANVLIGANNASPAPYTGAITTTGTGGLQKVGTGTLILGGTASNFYDFAINTGAVILRGGDMTLTSAVPVVVRSSMTMESGAQLDTRGGSVVIDPSSGTATWTLTGATTRWRANQITVGSGLASLVVDAGAAITDALSISISRAVTNFTTQNPATLLIQGGGSVTSDTGKLGNSANGSGVATVSGAGSLWTIASSLTLGRTGAFGTGSTKLVVSNGGTVAVGGDTSMLSTASSIEANGGTFATASLSGPIGEVKLTSPTSILAITGNSGAATYSAAVSGTGNLVKSGASTQIFDGSLTYTGTTTVNAGTLSLVSGGSRTFIVNGGTLAVPYSDFGTRSFKANSAGTILYQTNAISGGFLRGLGNHDLTAVDRVEGTTLGSDVDLKQNHPMTMINVTSSGALTSNAPLTIDGFNLTSAGQLTFNTDATIEAFESGGVLNIIGESTVNNISNNMVLGAGSRTFIGAPGREGGTLLLRDRTRLELNGALLVNNGTIDGPTDVNFGSVAKGSGRYGDVNVTDGGKFSPGNSPGTVTTGSTKWNSGGSYLVEIGDALDAASRDLWLVDGQLTIDALLRPFTISLASMDGLIFDNTRDYDWPILHADNISAFDSSQLALDTTSFKNNLGAGHFSLQTNSTDLIVHFTAVPEPTVMTLLLIAASATGRRRSGRKTC